MRQVERETISIARDDTRRYASVWVGLIIFRGLLVLFTGHLVAASFLGEKWPTTGGWRYASRVQAPNELTDKRTMRTRNAPQSQT